MNAQQAREFLENHTSQCGAIPTAMFGKKTISLHGKSFVCFLDNSAGFRLGRSTSAHAAALQLNGSTLFDPAGKSRPFRDWVDIPVKHALLWPDFADAAIMLLVSEGA